MTTRPNQGTYQSLRNAIRVMLLVAILAGLVCILLAGAIFGPMTGIPLAPILGLLAGMTSGFVFGGYAVIKHAVLRLLLQRRGLIPRNYSSFLEFGVEECVLMRKVAGGYIFIHRYLLEYFADFWMG